MIFQHIYIRKRNSNSFLGNMPLLYPAGKEIELAKYNNLHDLLPYVPPYLHMVYNNLRVKDEKKFAKNDNEDCRQFILSTQQSRNSSIEQKEGFITRLFNRAVIVFWTKRENKQKKRTYGDNKMTTKITKIKFKQNLKNKCCILTYN